MVGLGVGRSGRRGAHERADGAAEGQHALDGVGLEVGADEVAGRSEDEAREQPLVVGTLELGREVPPPPALGRHQEVLPEDHPDPGTVGLEAGPGGCVAPRELRHLGNRPRHVRIDDQRAAVGEDRRVLGVAHVAVEPGLPESQLVDDLRLQHPDRVGGDVEAEAGKQLLGDAGSAEHLPALEHEDRQPRLGEVARGRQPVVAAADDDCVVRLHLLSVRERPDPIPVAAGRPRSSFVSQIIFVSSPFGSGPLISVSRTARFSHDAGRPRPSRKWTISPAAPDLPGYLPRLFLASAIVIISIIGSIGDPTKPWRS